MFKAKTPSKMCREFIQHVFERVQGNSSCHNKYLQLLENLFNKTPTDEFLNVFVSCLRKVFCKSSEESDGTVEKLFDFCSAFIKLIDDKEERDATNDGVEYNNEFLSQIVQETLKYHNTVLELYRYNACQFITTLLEHVGNATLNNDICDAVQESMLITIDDPKISVRLKAITALVRLQDPRNPDCPIMQAYISMLSDSNAQIRRAIVKEIAPNAYTLPKIRDCTRDCEHIVRKMAFKRCADLGPKIFRIADRHAILVNGFTETHQALQNYFEKYLLDKWFTAYSNVVEFLASIKLDADEHDIKSTFELSKKILHVLFKTNPINDLIHDLPVEENKLVSPNKLTYEVTTFWCILVEYLRKDNSLEEYLDTVIPELTLFCEYIDKVVKIYSSKTLEDWEYLDYQCILLNLFYLLGHYQMDDETGRRTTHKLIIQLLEQHKFVYKLVSEMLSILSKIVTDANVLTNEICEVISEIREPMTPVVEEAPELPKHPENDLEFKLAQLKVKLTQLDIDKEEAAEKEDYRKAAQLQNEMVKIRAQMQELSTVKAPNVVEKKTVDNSKETICRCLDIINSVLILPTVKRMTASLRTCLYEFILKLLRDEDNDIHWRVLKSASLYCIIDKKFADEYGKILMLPIASYRLVPYANKMAVITSLGALSDLLRLYDSNMFCLDSESSSNSTKRHLYHSEDTEDGSDHLGSNLSLGSIMNIVLDMMDDEDEDIRDAALMTLMKLCLNKFTIKPTLLSRIILKWYNPTTDVKLQQKLGLLITKYAENNKNASETFEKAVVPTLVTVLGAPKTSPLSDVDVDNVMKLFACLTLVNTPITHFHRNIAIRVLQEICKKTEDSEMCSLAKMLLYLNIEKNNEQSMQELVRLLEIALEEVSDQKAKKHLQKFSDYLKSDRTENVPDDTTEQVQSNEVTSETLQSMSTLALNETENNQSNRLPNAKQNKQKLDDISEEGEEEVSVQRKSLRTRKSTSKSPGHQQKKQKKVEVNREGREKGSLLQRKSLRLRESISKSPPVPQQNKSSSGDSFEKDNYTIETPTSPSSTRSSKRTLKEKSNSLDSSNSTGSSPRRSKRHLKRTKSIL